MKRSVCMMLVLSLGLGCKSGGEVKEDSGVSSEEACGQGSGGMDPIAVALSWASEGMPGEVESGAKVKPWLVANQTKEGLKVVRAASLEQGKWQVVLALGQEPEANQDALGVTLELGGACGFQVERLDVVPSTLFWPEL